MFTVTDWLTCSGGKTLEDKIDNYCDKITEAEICWEMGERQKEKKLFFVFQPYLQNF